MSPPSPPSSLPPKPSVPTTSELPVTRAMLFGVRDELRARIDGTNARIDGTNARIDETNARIDELRHDLTAEIHRLAVLVEAQESQNRIVLEVVQGHNARFERLESEIADIRGMFGEIITLLRPAR